MNLLHFANDFLSLLVFISGVLLCIFYAGAGGLWTGDFPFLSGTDSCRLNTMWGKLSLNPFEQIIFFRSSSAWQRDGLGEPAFNIK